MSGEVAELEARIQALSVEERVELMRARPVGVEHNIVNPGDKEFVFVEVEIK